MDLVSECALRVANIVWRPGYGGFAFTVVCKATFELRPGKSPLAATQEAVVEADVYDPGSGGLVFASELVPLKKRPEVLVVGHAYAPEGRPVSSLVVRLSVGEIDKTIQVVGDRSFDRAGLLSDPAPFTRMPLGWERAAGGSGTSNPAGIPVSEAARADAGPMRAPNLLPAGLQLTSRRDAIPPVGFGPIAPMWPSRTACLHGHAAWWNPARWHERPLPNDIDLSYFNAAPPDQQRAQPFGEGTTIYLENLHRRFANLPTRLAPITPAASVDHGAGPQPLHLRCDTLVIDTDRGLAMLVWRAHVVLDRPDQPGRVVVTGPPPAQAASAMLNQQPFDAEATLAPAMPSAAVLPFSRAASVVLLAVTAPPAATPSAAASEDVESTIDTTRAPVLVASAPVLPFAPPQESALQRSTAPTAGSGLPFVPAAANEPGEEPPTARRQDPPVPPPFHAAPASWPAAADPSRAEMPPAPAVAPVHSTPVEPVAPEPVAPAAQTLAPPAMIGPLATFQQPADTQDAEPAPAAEAAAQDVPVPDAEPEPDVNFDAYPPERCGAIAARVALDEAATGDILRAEDLDAPRWQRVHDHWVDRIRAEAARSRKKPLSDYDDAYVSTLEAKRGPIVLEDYARFAEAAERGDVAGVLAERGLPQGAWPHIHRVWIGRMIKDVKLVRQVRGAIDLVRAAG